MKRIVTVVFGFLMVCGNANAAGYTCDTTKKYSSCDAGRYLSYNGAYNATPTVGNTCAACPVGKSCAGGTAAPVACARGQYAPAGSATCIACPDPSTHYTTDLPDELYVKNADGTIDRTLVYAWSGFSSFTPGDISSCAAYISYDTAAGNFQVENIKYNSVTGKYDTPAYGWLPYYNNVKAGYYIETRYADAYCDYGSVQLYRYGRQCPAGASCPGMSTLLSCSDPDHPYLENDTLGYKICDDGSYQANVGQSLCKSCEVPDEGCFVAKTGMTGATSITACYLEPDTECTDERGTYHYIEKCYYDYFDVDNATDAEKRARCDELGGEYGNGCYYEDENGNTFDACMAGCGADGEPAECSSCPDDFGMMIFDLATGNMVCSETAGCM